MSESLDFAVFRLFVVWLALSDVRLSISCCKDVALSENSARPGWRLLFPSFGCPPCTVSLDNSYWIFPGGSLQNSGWKISLTPWENRCCRWYYSCCHSYIRRDAAASESSVLNRFLSSFSLFSAVLSLRAADRFSAHATRFVSCHKLIILMFACLCFCKVHSVRWRLDAKNRTRQPRRVSLWRRVPSQRTNGIRWNFMFNAAKKQLSRTVPKNQQNMNALLHEFLLPAESAKMSF